MAPIGGGPGGGGPVGISNSFTGPAQTLEITGNHGYCYTGDHPAHTTPVEAMKFTSGNYNFDGIFQVNMAVGENYVSSYAVSFAQIELNGSIVSHIVAGLTSTDSLTSNRQPIIIPAYTEVVVKLYSDEIEATRMMTATLTGNIIRN